MKIHILFFARARDITGRPAWDIDLPENSTIADLRNRMLQQFGEFSSLDRSLLWAVNNEYVSDTRVLKEYDQVACFPPVSGG